MNGDLWKCISFEQGVCVLVDIFYDLILNILFCAFVRLNSPHAKMNSQKQKFCSLLAGSSHESLFYEQMFSSDIA
jgi:hypothetical protein